MRPFEPPVQEPGAVKRMLIPLFQPDTIVAIILAGLVLGCLVYAAAGRVL